MKATCQFLARVTALLCLGYSSADAAVNLLFSGSVAATNWLDASGSATTLMVWGIVVDTEGNGFARHSYLPDFSFGATGGSFRQPQLLHNADGPSDDLLFLSPTPMARHLSGADGAPFGINRINTITQIPLFLPSNPGFLPPISPGDAFAIIWFDRTELVEIAPPGEPFGLFTHPLFRMPNDGTTRIFFPAFAGPDAPKPMEYRLVPEPGAALLTTLSCAALAIRRRR